jgi:hypothetical protein
MVMEPYPEFLRIQLRKSIMTRRKFLPLFFGLPALALGCKGDGNFTLFGYTTRPNFDPTIRSIYIPVFKLNTFVTTTERKLDVDLTDEVVREIGRRKTPMRVVSDPTRADTELIGTIVYVQKTVLNRNPENLTREAEMAIGVDVIWRDLRSGDLLTNRAPAVAANPAPANAFDPSIQIPPPPPPNDKPSPVRVTAVGRILPELGESNATADKTATRRLAVQIVNMMETNWNTPP